MADQYRFAISGLSKEYRDTAVNEEIMVDKETGEFLIKTADGINVSYDAISRFNNHVESVTKRAQELRLTGDLNVVELDDLELPTRADVNWNLIVWEPVSLTADASKRVLVSLDLDCLEVVDSDAVVCSVPPIVELTFTMKRESHSDQQYTIRNSLPVMNDSIFSGTEHYAEANMYSLELTGIKVQVDPANAGKELIHILNSILVIVE